MSTVNNNNGITAASGSQNQAQVAPVTSNGTTPPASTTQSVPVTTDTTDPEKKKFNWAGLANVAGAAGGMLGAFAQPTESATTGQYASLNQTATGAIDQLGSILPN